MARTYKKTIITRRPEYADRWLLLTTWDGSTLYRDAAGDLVAVRFRSPHGEMEVLGNGSSSLAALGRLLNQKEASVAQMLRRLVSPEMELERIFNAYRHEYVRCLFEDEQGEIPRGKHPHRGWALGRLYADFNHLFAALSGITSLYKKPPEYIDEVLAANNFAKSYRNRFGPINSDLDALLRCVRHLVSQGFGEKYKRDLYREFIAVKPGIHEVWMDLAYRSADQPHRAIHQHALKKRTPPTEQRLRVLAGIHGLQDTPITWKDRCFSTEIKVTSFRTFAACAVTEGPCHVRKSIAVRLFDVLAETSKLRDTDRVGSRAAIRNRCLVFDFRRELEDCAEVVDVLDQMRRFCTHSIRWQRPLQRGRAASRP
jgi:hypothetical protein